MVKSSGNLPFMDSILHIIVANPAAVGAILVFLLKLVDGSGVLLKYNAPIHKVYLVLALLASFAGLADQGKLELLDVNGSVQFLTYWLSILVGGKAMQTVVTPKEEKK